MYKKYSYTVVSSLKVNDAVEKGKLELTSNKNFFNNDIIVEKIKRKNIYHKYNKNDFIIIGILMEIIIFQYELFNQIKFPLTNNEEKNKENKTIIADIVIEYTNPIVNNILKIDENSFNPVWNKLTSEFTIY